MSDLIVSLAILQHQVKRGNARHEDRRVRALVNTTVAFVQLDHISFTTPLATDVEIYNLQSFLLEKACMYLTQP